MSLVKGPTSMRFSGTRRRVEILEAALHRFAERGYEATTVEEIRERCRASNGSFYHFFPSKQDVAVALFVEYSRQYADALEAVVAEQRTARASVVSMATFAIRWAFDDEPYFARVAESLLPEIVKAGADDVAPFAARIRRALQESYGLWSRRGAVKPLDADLLHPVLFGPAEAYVRQRLGGDTTLEPDHATRAIGHLVWEALRVRD